MSENQAKWYVLRVAPKREHIVAKHLRTLEEIEVFSPQLRYRKATRRGKIWWVEAMFPGYVLAKFVISEKLRIVSYAQGVRGAVRFGAEVPAVSEILVEKLREEIAKQRDDTESEDILTLHPKVYVGDSIEVASGPLQGSEGTVLEVLSGKERVRVLLEFLGGPKVVEVDLYSLLLPRKPLPEKSDEG